MGFLPLAFNAGIEKVTNSPKFGTVVANNDPLQIGRVKVNIPGIFTGSVDTLPWVRRKLDTIFCGDDCEIFDVPEVGSIVEVRWPYDDHTPVYSGATQSLRHKSSVFTENYPHEAGIKFGPHVIKFDKASNLLTIENGTLQIVLDTFGDVNIKCGTFTCNCDKFFIDGDLHVGGNIEAKSLDIDNGASGAICLSTIAPVGNGIIQGIA